MADPSSQKIAEWAVEFAQPEWRRLDVLCYESVREKWETPTDEYVADVVARELPNVRVILQDMIGVATLSGETLLFEIDDDDLPYVRGINKDCFTVVSG